MEKRNQFAYLLGFGVLFGIVISILLKSFSAMYYLLLFYLPITPWLIRIKTDLFEKIALNLILGLCVSTLIYYLLGVLEFTLSNMLYLTIPGIIFIIGLFYALRGD